MSEKKTVSPEMAFTIISTLRDQIEIQKMRIRKLKQQKQQREELLKECFEYIDWTSGIGSPISQQKLLDKIDEALK